MNGKQSNRVLLVLFLPCTEKAKANAREAASQTEHQAETAPEKETAPETETETEIAFRLHSDAYAPVARY